MDIDKLRDGYRPAAKRGAILFFVLSEMALINTMYQYSLASFLDVFQFSLKKSLPDSILVKRLRNIMDTLTHNVYNYACTGNQPIIYLASHACIPTVFLRLTNAMLHDREQYFGPLPLHFPSPPPSRCNMGKDPHR